MKLTKLGLLLMVLTVPVAAAPKDDPPLTMTLSTHVATEPAQVFVRVRVEPDARSRELSIEWWSQEGIGGSHSKSLNGEQERPRHEYTIKRMEAGEYLVTARVFRDDGSQLKQETKVIVTGDTETITGFDNSRR
jgi:hypothetical protein